MKTGMTELNQEQLEHVTGALYTNWGGSDPVKCYHDNKVKTGNNRYEVHDYFFFSTYEHLFEYHCPECGKTLWEEE